MWVKANMAVDSVRNLIPPRSKPVHGSLGPSSSLLCGAGLAAGVAGSAWPGVSVGGGVSADAVAAEMDMFFL